jgi:hypothetical protein
VTLRVPDVTEESVETVRSHLSALASRTSFPQRALTRANPAGLALAVPHDVYLLELGELAEGALLDAAKVVGRRFLVMDGDRAIASAELAESDDSGFEANEGPYVGSTAAAIARAEQDPELAEGDYEVRVLRMPALYFMGIWLKNEQGGADVVIPLDPAPAGLEARRKYAPEELLPLLSDRARKRLAFEDAGGTH